MQPEDFTFFYGGVFSQWYIRDFHVNNVRYNCCEQFMMVSKAVLFNDLDMAQKILRVTNPKDQKKLGRQVKGFREKTWKMFRRGIVFTGNYNKYNQHSDLKRKLLDTGKTIMVEASKTDMVWGNGLSITDDRRFDMSQWRGLNLLGQSLSHARESLAWDLL